MYEIILKLEDQGLCNEIVRREVGYLWKYGVDKVSDNALRAALICFLEGGCPLGFFVNPASSTKRHHPWWQCHKAGILRNTVECCLAVDRQLRAYPEFTDAEYNVLPRHRDIILVATILSDTFKYGESEITEGASATRLDPEHGKVAAERWNRVASRFPITTDAVRSIYDAIYWHLGRWTPGWSESAKLSVYAEVTHRIDMFFSDKNLELLYVPKERIGSDDAADSENIRNSDSV